MPEAAKVFLALGGNQGDVLEHFKNAVAALSDLPQTRIVARSALYATKPWGVTEQPDFINACLALETELTPQALLAHCLQIEKHCGRDRSLSTRWGPRPLDIDILSYDDVKIDEENLKLPHPEMFNRAFVLIPLMEIAGDRDIAGRSVRAAADACVDEGIRRLTANW